MTFQFTPSKLVCQYIPSSVQFTSNSLKIKPIQRRLTAVIFSRVIAPLSRSGNKIPRDEMAERKHRPSSRSIDPVSRALGKDNNKWRNWIYVIIYVHLHYSRCFGHWDEIVFLPSSFPDNNVLILRIFFPPFQRIMSRRNVARRSSSLPRISRHCDKGCLKRHASQFCGPHPQVVGVSEAERPVFRDPKNGVLVICGTILC